MFIHILLIAVQECSSNNNPSNWHSTTQMGLKHTPQAKWQAWRPLHQHYSGYPDHHPAQRHACLNSILGTPHPSQKLELHPWATQTRSNQISLMYDKLYDQSITWENRGVNIPLLIINKDKIRKKHIQLSTILSLV